MVDAMDFPKMLEFIRSGSAFAVGDPVGAGPVAQGQAEIRAAVRNGQMRHYESLLFPGFLPEWVVVEACVGNGYDNRGGRVASGHLDGDMRLVTNREWLTVADADATASTFSRSTLLLPGDNAVEVRLAEARGFVEVVFRLDRPARDYVWTTEHLRQDVLLYCTASGAVGLDAFRTLARGEWTLGGSWVWPRLGVRPPVEEPEVLRSPVCRLLARTQPPGADRILRLPTRVLAGLPGAEVRFRVRLGGEADGVVGALRGELRRNCLPVWNVGLAAVERSGGADGPPPEIDPHPLRTTADRITVLECIDRRNGRVWHDNRFASGYDPAETFTVGPADGARRSRAALNFEPPPVSADWRILYLAGLEPLGPLRPNTSWLVGPGPEHMVVRSGVMRGPGADGTMMADFPRGEVVTGAQLVELLWRIAPAPVRRQIDDEAVARLGAEAIDVRTELDVDAAVGGGDRRRATPVTIVTLPQRLGGEDLSYWLLGMGREAGLYTRGRVEVRLEPGGGAT